MRLISLNLWYGERPDAIKQFLQDNLGQTDLFCFQETLGAESLLDEVLSGRGFKMREALKYASEDYQLRTYVSGDIEIVSTAEVGASLKDSGLAIAVELLMNGRPQIIINVHGVSRPGDKLDSPGRIKQSEVIIDYLKDKRDIPQIICGDFNLLPLTKSVAMFEDVGYRNLINDHQIPTTRNELAWSKHPDNKQLFADYAFVSDLVKVNQFTVPDILISDHLPMIIDYELVQ